MKHTKPMPNVAQLAALFNKPYYIVERSVPQGDGSSYTLYMSLPGTWSESEDDALKFPQRILAESHANRFKGTVVEKRP